MQCLQVTPGRAGSREPFLVTFADTLQPCASLHHGPRVGQLCSRQGSGLTDVARHRADLLVHAPGRQAAHGQPGGDLLREVGRKAAAAAV